MRLRTIIGCILVLAAAYFLYDSLSQPNVKTLAGNFRETASYRNPNNTGPIRRIYTVTVEDTLWKEMQQYGEMMPYTKYGVTTVYFFRDDMPAPDSLSPAPPYFDRRFREQCLGVYEKDAMSSVTFIRYPFSEGNTL